jgi:4'-phosphopantetheinyl transferase
MLAAGQIHLWYARPHTIDEARLERYARLLTEEEAVRWRRFHFERHRREFLVTRALCRAALSQHAQLAPAAWRFRVEPDGKPELEPQPGMPALRFNLSNTDGMVVCAVGLAHDVGVDVENTGCGVTTLDVAERYFAPSEVAALATLTPAAQRRRFFEYWTLKEAYIKARGEGVRLGLDRFAFEIGDPIRISFVPGFDDDPSAWSFRLLTLSPHHQAALAVRTPGPIELTVRELVPVVG